MSLGVHPRTHNAFGAYVAAGDVFTCVGIGNAALLHHGKRGAVCRTFVRKIAVFLHIQRFCPRTVAKIAAERQSGKSVFGALGVAKIADGFFKIGCAGACARCARCRHGRCRCSCYGRRRCIVARICANDFCFSCIYIYNTRWRLQKK